MNKKTIEQPEFKAGGNNKEYKIEDICNSAVYARELEASHLSELYYLVFRKSYLIDENT